MGILSLFSGCGGCSLGLMQEGLEVNLAVDINQEACDTYSANIKQNIALDQQSKALINKARHLGGSGPTVNLENHELLRLCAVIASDLNQTHLATEIMGSEDLPNK